MSAADDVRAVRALDAENGDEGCAAAVAGTLSLVVDLERRRVGDLDHEAAAAHLARG